MENKYLIYFLFVFIICDLIKQNESELANTIFKMQPNCFYNPSIVNIFRTNCLIVVGFSQN